MSHDEAEFSAWRCCLPPERKLSRIMTKELALAGTHTRTQQDLGATEMTNLSIQVRDAQHERFLFLPVYRIRIAHGGLRNLRNLALTFAAQRLTTHLRRCT